MSTAAVCVYGLARSCGRRFVAASMRARTRVLGQCAGCARAGSLARLCGGRRRGPGLRGTTSACARPGSAWRGARSAGEGEPRRCARVRARGSSRERGARAGAGSKGRACARAEGRRARVGSAVVWSRRRGGPGARGRGGRKACGPGRATEEGEKGGRREEKKRRKGKRKMGERKRKGGEREKEERDGGRFAPDPRCAVGHAQRRSRVRGRVRARVKGEQGDGFGCRGRVFRGSGDRAEKFRAQ